ncbi:response regulator transcription factor [Clostridia bacterium OttesenSCG-928-O13]|nr:response regulator transcription factor [Clostridia bacterium OttesenSCG-928-O13]
MNILAVDDEQRGIRMLSQAIAKALPNATLSSFRSSCDALKHAEENPVDVAFLDVKMPDLDGLGLAARLKERHPKINIIFVTGHSEYANDAFALHASGYVHKPVSPRAVLEQMENLRFAPAKAREMGPYTFDHVAQRVYCNGEDTLLNPKEYSLFCLLANNPEVFLPPEELFCKVWGDDPNGNVHTVYVRVSSLRQKLKMDGDSMYYIEQKRGRGYRLTKK